MKKKIITILFLAISTLILGGCGENEEENPKLTASYKKIYRQAPSKISTKKMAYIKGIEIDEEKLGGLLSDKYISKTKIIGFEMYSVSHAKIDQKPEEKISVFTPIIRETQKNTEKEKFTINTHGPEGYIEQLGITGRGLEGHIELTGAQNRGPEGYIALTNAQNRGPEGYIELTGAQTRGPEGYIALTGAQNRGPEGYTELTNAQNRGPEGYTELTGAQNRGPEGYIELTGAQNRGPEGYIELTGAQNRGSEGYTELTNAQNRGPEGYTELTNAQTRGPEGYIDSLGVTHNWTDELINEIWSYWNLDGLFMQALLGEDIYIKGYTHKLGITGRDEEQGYVEKTGAQNHGSEGYIENVYYYY